MLMQAIWLLPNFKQNVMMLLIQEPPIVVVGNKKDIEVERMVTEREGRKLAESLHCLFYEISGKKVLDFTKMVPNPTSLLQ